MTADGVTADGEGARKGRITSIEGIPALSLDAISSVAYGPEAMLVVLATAGAGALAKIEPITIAIVVLPLILVFSYRQVIAAFPEGGGCYAVSKANLGARASHTRSIATPVLEYLASADIRDRKVIVLIPELEPRKWRHRLLQNQRGAILADVLRRRSTAAVGRVPYHLDKD